MDTNFDGEIQVTEAEAVTGLLDVNGQFHDIYDLTGIEAFVNITELWVFENQLSTLDLTSNTKLVHLECWANQLTSINVSSCSLLQYFDCVGNLINSLDISQNKNLQYFTCGYNQIISIDVTNNSYLETFGCYNNELTFLDIRNGNNTAIASFTSYGNPELTCIFADDKSYWETNFSGNIDPNSTFVETQTECDALGLNNYEFKNLNIYPNPVEKNLYIDFDYEWENEIVELVINDASGKGIYKTFLSSKNNEINISQIKQGMYFLSLYKNSKRLFTKKISKL